MQRLLRIDELTDEKDHEADNDRGDRREDDRAEGSEPRRDSARLLDHLLGHLRILAHLLSGALEFRVHDGLQHATAGDGDHSDHDRDDEQRNNPIASLPPTEHARGRKEDVDEVFPQRRRGGTRCHARFGHGRKGLEDWGEEACTVTRHGVNIHGTISEVNACGTRDGR